MSFLKLLLLTNLLIISACAPAAAEVIPPSVGSVTPPGAGNNLANTRWTLVSFGTPGAEMPVMAGSTVTLEFKGDNQIGGSGGCNSYGGEYRVQGNSLSFSQVNSTLMACADEGVTRQEQQYLQALPTTGEFELAGDQLRITYNGGQGRLNFSLAAAVPPPAASPPAAQPPTPTPGEAAYENLDSPVDLLASYINAINRQEYARAYGYWEQPTTSYDDFVAGFRDTTSVQLIVQPPTRREGAAGSLYVAIPTIFVALHQDGSQHRFAGCVVTRKSNLEPPAVPQKDVWHLYQAQMAPVPDDAAIPALLAQACPG